MLLSITIKNWKCFRDETTFSMIASREQQHSNTLTDSNKYRLRVLPMAAIYGGNASGKTSLWDAISFAQDFILKGTPGPDSNIDVEPFLLDSSALEEPTEFKFVLLIDGSIYEYSFSTTSNKVVNEKLIQVLSRRINSLYERTIEKGIIFDKDEGDLAFIKNATRDNELFLTKTVMNNRSDFKFIFDWFKYKLVVISPTAEFQAIFNLISNETSKNFNQLLCGLDTGISRLAETSVPYDSLPLPASLKKKIINEIKEESWLIRSLDGLKFKVSKEKGKIVASKIVAMHLTSDGTEIPFELDKESSGTNRIIDLLPAFMSLSAKKDVLYFIDELDRSLHSLLTRRLINTFMNSCNGENGNQLIVTTHDVMLIDQDIFRRDELWITERDNQGVAALMSFSDYRDIRHDTDIRKSYIQGNFGGIPRLLYDYICKE